MSVVTTRTPSGGSVVQETATTCDSCGQTFRDSALLSQRNPIDVANIGWGAIKFISGGPEDVLTWCVSCINTLQFPEYPLHRLASVRFLEGVDGPEVEVSYNHSPIGSNRVRVTPGEFFNKPLYSETGQQYGTLTHPVWEIKGVKKGSNRYRTLNEVVKALLKSNNFI